MRTRRTRRLIGCGLLALALGLSVPAVATADDAPPTAAPGDLALVTMNGGGTAAGRAEARRAAGRAGRRAHRRRCRRARLPLDHRAQRLRRPPDRGPAGRPRRPARRRLGRGRLDPPDGRAHVVRGRPWRRGQPAPARRGRRGDRRRRLGHRAGVARVRGGARASAPTPRASPAPAPRATAGRPTTAPARSSAPAGTSTASAPTASGRRSRCRPATRSGTAPRSPRSRPATPVSASGSTTATPASSAAWPRRRGSPPTRPAGEHPTPPTTAARPPTSCPRSTPRSPTASTSSASPSPVASCIDTLQVALLGAAEADVVVIGASGNAGRSAYAAHAAPWVTTVGAAVGRMSRGRVVLPGGRSWDGGGRPATVRGRAVLAQDAAAPGASRRAAAQCRLGALDSRLVADRVVVCQRGGDRAHRQVRVRRAGRWPRHGARQPSPRLGDRRPPLRPDRPPVRVGRSHASAAGCRATPAPGVTVSRVAGDPGTRRTARWSAAGDPRGTSVKPDAVADGDAVLGALPESTGRTWGVFSGSSAATAHASGLAALVLGEHPDRSAVGRPVAPRDVGAPDPRLLRPRAGRRRPPEPRTRPPTSRSTSLPSSGAARCAATPSRGSTRRSLLLPARQRRAVRTVTNIGTRPEYFSVTTRGFTSHRVRVQPLAVRLAPGRVGRLHRSRSPAPPLPAGSTTACWSGSAPAGASPACRSP